MPELLFTHRCKHCKLPVKINDGNERDSFIGQWIHYEKDYFGTDYDDSFRWLCNVTGSSNTEDKDVETFDGQDISATTVTHTVKSSVTTTTTIRTQYVEQPIGRKFRYE